MWRIILPLMVLACLVGCAPAASQDMDDPLAPEKTGMQAESTGEANEPAGTLTNVQTVMLQNGMIELGSPVAPHSLLLFVTPGSAYSETYVSQYLPKISEIFVKTGKLKVDIVFVPFSRYPQTDTATLALLCAAKAGNGSAALLSVIESPSSNGMSTDCGLDASILPNLKTLISSLHVTLVPTAFFDGEKETGLPEWTDLRAKISNLVLE